jgi:hypothetical protein
VLEVISKRIRDLGESALQRANRIERAREFRELVLKALDGFQGACELFKVIGERLDRFEGDHRFVAKAADLVKHGKKSAKAIFEQLGALEDFRDRYGIL